MKRLAILAAVLVLAACRVDREEAIVDTLPDMAPPPAVMDPMPPVDTLVDTLPQP